MTTTGDAGEFSFDNVTSGRYELWVARVGFVTASYGERSPGAGRSGIPIVVGEKIRNDNLLVRIPRGGAISGTILDEFGDPAMGASVTVLRYRTVNGRRTLVCSGGGEVDDSSGPVQCRGSSSTRSRGGRQSRAVGDPGDRAPRRGRSRLCVLRR